ncbi:Hypothetical predicted protein [Mytilus galloprovincialis]|uniref:Uncharacterized protein n=1 Tax=Mytilus galloprovincialis TaxID=29158 RepID=A0A8B6BQ65_MYTGA|nr:Hypothetical predicted protein [Mytilus galloprovincialis]
MLKRKVMIDVTQDSTISRQAKRLPHRKNTIFTNKLLSGKSSVVQSHLARIADFIIPGDRIWWHYDGENVVFHDSIDGPNFRLEPTVKSVETISTEKVIIPPKKHNGKQVIQV